MKRLFKKAIDVLDNKRGDGYIDVAVKMIIAVVIGALLLGGLYYLFNNIVLPGLAERMQPFRSLDIQRQAINTGRLNQSAAHTSLKQTPMPMVTSVCTSSPFM